MHRTNRTQAQLRAVLALSGWVALAATLLPGGSFLRWAPVLLFVTFGPGLAVLHPRPRSEPGGPPRGTRLETLALAAPLSWSLATLAATALFLVSGFSATVFLTSLAAFCTVAALLPGLPLPAAMRGAGDPADEAAAAGAGAGAGTGAETGRGTGAETGAGGGP